MRDLKFILQQKYETSRALVIGINQYKNASPLGYAVNDAHEVREILVDELGFETENVIYLADQDATKSGSKAGSKGSESIEIHLTSCRPNQQSFVSDPFDSASYCS